ncbi:hypothetical protein V8E36_005643 [Tilletia maclaganii]
MAAAVQSNITLVVKSAQQPTRPEVTAPAPTLVSSATPASATQDLQSATGAVLSSSIDEFLDLPSSAPTPSTPAPAASNRQQTQPQQQRGAATTKPAFRPAAATPSQAEIQSLVANAPIAAASLANGPPPPGSSPEILFRYYLASELRRQGSPFDDSVIDKYVKQHAKTLDAARKAGSTSPAAQLSPSATPSVEGQASAASVLSAASLLNGLAPPMSVNLAPSPFKLAAGSMGSHTTASIDTAAIFSPAAVSASLPAASINPHLVSLAPAATSGSSTKATAASAVPIIKVEPRTPQIESTDIMDESDFEHDLKEEEDDNEEDDDDLDEEMSMSRTRSSSATTSPSTSMQSNGSKAMFKKLNFTNSAIASPGSVLGVPASLAAISEDLRPSAEEYRKLSSKEKRQLRNKISARNFRTRRKEYIGQLEDQIADRDQIIEGLRQQVAHLNVTNRDLNEEIKTLRERTLSQTDVSRILEALQKNVATSSAPAVPAQTVSMPVTTEMGPPAAPLPAAAAVTLPTLAGSPALTARTPMRASNSNASLSDFFGSITGASANNRPGTPMQVSRPSTPLSPLFPALGVSSGAASNTSGTGLFSPSLRPSIVRRPSPANFNLGSSYTSGAGSSSNVHTSSGVTPLGRAGPITQPNTKKDVAPNASADSFWAGSSNGAPGSSPFGAGAGGFMQVHMTLVDELLFPAAAAVPNAAPARDDVGGLAGASAKLAERCAERARRAQQLRRSASTALLPPAYSASSVGAGSDVKKPLAAFQPTSTGAFASSSTEKRQLQQQQQSQAKGVPAPARVQVEDAFMRLLLGEEGDVEAEQSIGDVPPSYGEATRQGNAQLLLAGPVPTYCKV